MRCLLRLKKMLRFAICRLLDQIGDTCVLLTSDIYLTMTFISFVNLIAGSVLNVK